MRVAVLFLTAAAFALIGLNVARFLMSPAFDASPASQASAAVAAHSPALTTDRAGMGSSE